VHSSTIFLGMRMVSVSCRSPPSRPNFFRLSHTECAHTLSPNEQVTLSLLSSTHHHRPLPPDSPEAHQVDPPPPTSSRSPPALVAHPQLPQRRLAPLPPVAPRGRARRPRSVTVLGPLLLPHVQEDGLVQRTPR
jgi:hypothetical protein